MGLRSEVQAVGHVPHERPPRVHRRHRRGHEDVPVERCEGQVAHLPGPRAGRVDEHARPEHARRRLQSQPIPVRDVRAQPAAGTHVAAGEVAGEQRGDVEDAVVGAPPRAAARGRHPAGDVLVPESDQQAAVSLVGRELASAQHGGPLLGQRLPARLARVLPDEAGVAPRRVDPRRGLLLEQDHVRHAPACEVPCRGGTGETGTDDRVLVGHGAGWPPGEAAYRGRRPGLTRRRAPTRGAAPA